MERMLGRCLLPGEVVHHTHERPLDNRRSELELLASRSEHGKRHGFNGRRPDRESNPWRGIYETSGGRFVARWNNGYFGTFGTREEARRALEEARDEAA
jgi:hypothetical protein